MRAEKKKKVTCFIHELLYNSSLQEVWSNTIRWSFIPSPPSTGLASRRRLDTSDCAATWTCFLFFLLWIASLQPCEPLGLLSEECNLPSELGAVPMDLSAVRRVRALMCGWGRSPQLCLPDVLVAGTVWAPSVSCSHWISCSGRRRQWIAPAHGSRRYSPGNYRLTEWIFYFNQRQNGETEDLGSLEARWDKDKKNFPSWNPNANGIKQ